ncbi:MAG: hypothetical protein FRX48_06496 [Lasallia pustulata]|uniref:Uncharacterized protein n=1 Tax=Lasallia pustulata TaxID=136370 RepID=A0A5M8PKA4_9LECA|nr:MAG: hypothetical protein FRX48_06496 [Lasallia pustulata]
MRFPLPLLAILALLAAPTLSIPHLFAAPAAPAAFLAQIRASNLSPPPCIGHVCPDKFKRHEEPGQSNPPCLRGTCPDEVEVELKARITALGLPGPDKVKRYDEPGQSHPPCLQGVCPDKVEVELKEGFTAPAVPGPDGVEESGQSEPHHHHHHHHHHHAPLCLGKWRWLVWACWPWWFNHTKYLRPD